MNYLILFQWHSRRRSAAPRSGISGGREQLTTQWTSLLELVYMHAEILTIDLRAERILQLDFPLTSTLWTGRQLTANITDRVTILIALMTVAPTGMR